LLDPAVAKSIEYVFGERDSFPVYMKAEQFAFWRTIEDKTARDERNLGNQHLHVKTQVRNRFEVSRQHLAITGQPEALAVVLHVVMNKLAQTKPVLPVQA